MSEQELVGARLILDYSRSLCMMTIASVHAKIVESGMPTSNFAKITAPRVCSCLHIIIAFLNALPNTASTSSFLDLIAHVGCGKLTAEQDAYIFASFLCIDRSLLSWEHCL